MTSSLLRLAVALLTFGLGVSATTFWIAYRTPDIKVSGDTAGYKYPVPPPRPQAFLIEDAPAEPPPLLPHVVIDGGVLNGKALSLPQPAYPSGALEFHASGTVIVKVSVDENGNVISAKATSGHPLLQQAAVEAAYRASFAPTRLSGQPVKVSGLLAYNFVLR